MEHFIIKINKIASSNLLLYEAVVSSVCWIFFNVFIAIVLTVQYLYFHMRAPKSTASESVIIQKVIRKYIYAQRLGKLLMNIISS